MTAWTKASAASARATARCCSVLLALVALFYVISIVRMSGLGSDGAPASRRRNNGTTVVLLLSVVAGMIGLAFASVPLYSLFCRATGWGGTTQRAAAAPKEVADAFVTVRFDAETAPDLGWEFRPLTRAIKVRPGEPHEVFFRADEPQPPSR